MSCKTFGFIVPLATSFVLFSQLLYAGVDSCLECSILMDGDCLAKKYLPSNQLVTPEKEWSAFEGNFFSKDNIIGVRFQLNDESVETLKYGTFGLEIEVVEINSHKLIFDYWDSNLPQSARLTADTEAFDGLNKNKTNAVIIRNPEQLDAYKDYYVWFHFRELIPESGVIIQPNMVIDIDSDCPNAKRTCYDVVDEDICEYYQMETDSFAKFTAIPNGNGIKWDNHRDSEQYNPEFYKSAGRWHVDKEINPPDPEDSEVENEDDNLPSSITSQKFSSSSRPELYVSELSFRDDKTKYYDDETIHLDGYVKNGGKSVDGKIKKIALKLYRFKGEKENGDVKEVGDENIKGENLSKGKTKHEEFSFGAPSTEAKYQLYAVIDAKNAVSESNEKNNRSGSIAFRVHKRPDIKVGDLSFKDGQVLFEVDEIPKAWATFINSGGEPFQDVPVKWYVDGEHFAYDNMRHWNIEHGDEKQEDVNLAKELAIGNHTLKVCADLPEDDDKSDNCKEIAFEVFRLDTDSDMPKPSPVINIIRIL